MSEDSKTAWSALVLALEVLPRDATAMELTNDLVTLLAKHFPDAAPGIDAAWESGDLMHRVVHSVTACALNNSNDQGKVVTILGNELVHYMVALEPFLGRLDIDKFLEQVRAAIVTTQLRNQAS